MSQTITLTRKLAVATNEEIYTIDELIKRRAAELGDAPLIGYPKEGVTDYEEHSARALDRYADAAAEALQRKGLEQVDAGGEQAPAVGILAQSGLHVIITTLGLSRLGYAVLLLSTRLASPAISRLLDLARCDTLLTTPGFHPVLAEVQKEQHVNVLELLAREDYCRLDAPVLVRKYEPEKERRKRSIIIHSSGSTGLPKPIFLTHMSCIAAFTTNLDRRALITSPFFHSHCFYETFRSIYSGKPIYYCNYALPLTKQSVTAMLDHVKPDLFHCVPYVLKLLAESEEGIQALAKVNFVLFAGSACPDDLGDTLVKRGVNLNANYGATETSRLMTSGRPAGDDAWNYLRILPQVAKWVLMDEIAPGIHECVALDGLRSKSTINSDDPPRSFRTRDLFTPHPARPGLWKYVSRLDDRFTLVNGEKVLPVPIEGRIRQEPSVQEAIVFGDGKTVPGVLIVKADRAADVPDDEFLANIWPAVEDANSRAETFSQIPKELIVVVPAGTEYPRTDKGTFIRALTYAQFKQEIEAAYSSFETDESGSLTLEGSELETYLMQRFHDHTGVTLESVESDFFASGVDSLQCIKMWSLIKKELDLGGRQSQLGQNVLYETGNVRALAQHLDGLRRGSADAAKDERRIMADLIAKYSSFAPIDSSVRGRAERRVVLLTGTTGGLGAHLLAQLVANPEVSAVWALVRADSDQTAHERVLTSLEKRGLAITPEAQQKIVALASDLSKPDFGLDETKIDELRCNLVAAIHSAWAVNFNISVSSFEDQHIKAVHNLISFCRSTSSSEPARFFFCSSVSAAAGTPRPGIVAETIVTDAAHVQGTGYARSKFVAEHITRNANKDAGAVARNLRVGQLIGDTKVGEWNTTEGIPLMIQTAVTLGALPALDEEMSWLPVDVAASIVLDLVLSSGSPSDPDLVYHVLNPHRFHWTHDMLPALREAGLSFEVLPKDQWMERLRTSDRDPIKNPPIKLLDWFESKYGRMASTTNKGSLDYLTDQTAMQSSSLRSVPDVTQRGFVEMVVSRLRSNWGEENRS
ncbi:acetyl-CoA synthetase-like protein [Lentithecium fluviatile CBS 122367]|uniref:Acetyl-CoA synthetase-like protein n=1 Tax=Lentithecium fluviatile CBS 122367 TaxID=1168545 RepID=A0A6G1IEB9_9PLEO|nr:acetyl-CoA synthetase-like protein [Lentithecium fluviatile CBS 122367]